MVGRIEAGNFRSQHHPRHELRVRYDPGGEALKSRGLEFLDYRVAPLSRKDRDVATVAGSQELAGERRLATPGRAD
jgi:hypothetical protein